MGDNVVFGSKSRQFWTVAAGAMVAIDDLFYASTLHARTSSTARICLNLVVARDQISQLAKFNGIVTEELILRHRQGGSARG